MGCGLDRPPRRPLRATLPRREAPPSITSGDYARRDQSQHDWAGTLASSFFGDFLIHFGGEEVQIRFAQLSQGLVTEVVIGNGSRFGVGIGLAG